MKCMIIVAHPDDGEINAGGFALRLSSAGHAVRILSMTNGATGHHVQAGAVLARRRRKEMARASAKLGADSDVMDISSNALEPAFWVRAQLIERIRLFNPDIIITCRPRDYHPDHRACSQTVQDAVVGLTNPQICPLTPEMKRMPVILYHYDRFQEPPFIPDFLVPIDAVLRRKNLALHEHTSQMYEWLPYCSGRLDSVPQTRAKRLKWLPSWRYDREIHLAGKFQHAFTKTRGKAVVQKAEGFAVAEHGRSLSDREKNVLTKLGACWVLKK